MFKWDPFKYFSMERCITEIILIHYCPEYYVKDSRRYFYSLAKYIVPIFVFFIFNHIILKFYCHENTTCFLRLLHTLKCIPENFYCKSKYYGP